MGHFMKIYEAVTNKIKLQTVTLTCCIGSCQSVIFTWDATMETTIWRGSYRMYNVYISGKKMVSIII